NLLVVAGFSRLKPATTSNSGHYSQRVTSGILYAGIGLEQAQVFVLGIAIGHAGQIIAHGSLHLAVPSPPAVALRQLPGRPAVLLEKKPEKALTFVRHAHDPVMAIDAPVQELFERRFEGPQLRSGPDQHAGSPVHVV